MPELKVASRRLVRKCIDCGRSFNKGDEYYRNRYVFVDTDSLIEKDKVCAKEWLECVECVETREREEAHRRYLRESGLCLHEDTELHYSLISGEDCVYEPDYEECLICGAKM